MRMEFSYNSRKISENFRTLIVLFEKVVCFVLLLKSLDFQNVNN